MPSDPSPGRREPDRVRVTAADFNGETWDGSPFTPPAPRWLLNAVGLGKISVNMDDATDYAKWNVWTPTGNVVAGPGDVIGIDKGQLFVEASR